MSTLMFPWVEHALSVGERVAVAGLPGGGMPLGIVERVNAKTVRVKMCAESYGTVNVSREQIDPIDWRCGQFSLIGESKRGVRFELRVDLWHHYWLWRLDNHWTIVRAIAADECTADLARLAVERVPWVECPCTIGDDDVLAQPDVLAKAVRR